MCKKATAFAVAVLVLGTGKIWGQMPPDWRHIGNNSIDRSLAGLATGPVDRVQYSPDGSHLAIRTASGHLFETSDFETWHPTAALSPASPVPDSTAAVPMPEPGARIRTSGTGSSPRLYAFGNFVYRSDDGGASWENLTAFRSSSIVGNDLQDLAVSPRNEDEITVASSSGVFRSLDGGRSWSGLNQGLVNLPAMRLLSLPDGDQGVRLALNDGSVVEWEPGQKQAWSPAVDTAFLNEQHLKQSLSAQRGVVVTAVLSAPGFLYTGMANGTLSVSTDGGVTWRSFAPEETGAVERFWVDPANPRVALAVFGSRVRDPASTAPAVQVMRTQNGGVFWDDLTSNLPDTGAHGITADPVTGAIYVASGDSVFLTYIALDSLGAAQPWTALPGLPQAAVKDVKLDPQGNQLWVALDGLGVYSTLAPHRLRDPRVVSSADFVARAAAPGSLVTVLGASVRIAHAGDLPAPVLDANDAESQIQIPFETRGTSVSLTVNASSGALKFPAMPLETAAPSIFVDRDGSPLLLDSDSGIMLNAMTPAHSGAHIQILATGLGRVKPDWPTGLAAPLENPPQVSATVTAYLDREPVEVTRAVLAPYIGFYLVEIEIPKIVNYGPAELYIQAEDQSSNRVRVYIAP